jgi:chemotaxis protein MotB
MSRSQKERPGDYFASMTDLLVGVLFILIIMVAYLAFQINTEDRVPKTAYDAIKKERDAAEQKILSLEKEVSDLLSQIERLRREIERLLNADKIRDIETYISLGINKRDQIVLSTVRELRALDIDARVGRANNVVTISGANLFASGRSDLGSKEDALGRVNALANVIREKISCFAISPLQKAESVKLCNPNFLFIEAVFIEGHTDDVPVQRLLPDGSRNNLELSAKRATNTYLQMVRHVPALVDFSNPNGEQALSVAAYGEQRPLVENISAEDHEINRRIDIRFDMFVPSSQESLEQFVEQFE